MSGFLTRLVRHAIEPSLRQRGYELKIAGMPPRGFANFLTYVRSCGLSPKTVFDIGVGYGTPWLYEGFPGAKFVLIEALPRFEPQVRATAARLGADYHMVGLAQEKGMRRIRVPLSGATGASLLPRSAELASLQEGIGHRLEDDYVDIAVSTLDRIGNYEPPFFLKIDVEGAELEVLAGATETLRRTEMVLLEVSVFPRHEGEPSFAETVRFMDDAGFVLFDIVELAQSGPRGPLVYVDAAFAPKSNRLWRRQLPL